MDKETIIARFQNLGYSSIHDYDDVPGEFFADHAHGGEQLMAIVKGTMLVNMDGKDRELKAGDEFLFPAKRVHNAKIGPEGCEYIVGEKP